MTLSSLAASLGKTTDWILTEHILFPDFPESRAELLDAESVDDRVDGRVAVGEDDSDVNEEHGLVAVRAEESDAVEDVERKPADRKQEENESQRLGQLELLPKVSAGVGVAGRHLLVELLVDHVENLHIDGQHEQQRRQHPAEEVEINHVVHADDRLELTGHHGVIADLGAVVLQTLQVVPAQHGREAHNDGHQPTQQHGGAGSPRGHHTLVTHGDFDSQIAVDGDGQQRQDGTLRQDEHRACDQQAGVEVRLEPDADGDGERDDESPDRNVSQGQGDDEAERGVSERAVNAHSPDHHHVPDDGGHGDHHLHADVESLGGGQSRSHDHHGCWMSES